MTPDDLMNYLPIRSRLDRPYDQLFRRHERQLGSDALPDPLGVNVQAARDVHHQKEDRVSREKSFRYRQAPVGAVIERSLEVLHAVRLIRISVQRKHEARKGIDALAAHRVALVGHCGGTDLFILERLLDLS